MTQPETAGVQALDFEFQIQRSARRKTIGVVVRRAQVILQLPAHVSVATGVRFLQLKQQWIRRHLRQQQQQLQLVQPKRFVSGESFRWLGQDYPLQLTLGPRTLLHWSEQGFQLTLSRRIDESRRAARIEAVLKQWYQQQGLHYLQQRVTHFAQQMQVSVHGVFVRSYKAKWGACNSRGEVFFNWQLMMAPAWVIDYVVVHELAHRRYMDHSPAFWQWVAVYYPDWQTARRWLREQGTQLRWCS